MSPIHRSVCSDFAHISCRNCGDADAARAPPLLAQEHRSTATLSQTGNSSRRNRRLQARNRSLFRGKCCFSATPSQADTKTRQTCHERKSKLQQEKTHNLLSFARRVKVPVTDERKNDVDHSCCSRPCLSAVRTGSVLRRSGIEARRRRVRARWTIINVWVAPTPRRDGLQNWGPFFILAHRLT